MAFTIATKRAATTNSNTTRDEDEFAGLWINVGVETQAEGDDSEETKFNRLPRGIAVSDLKDHKVYASTNPDWAAEANLVNQIMAMVRAKGLELAEGEAVPINLSVQLYRRQEQVEQAATAVDSDLEAKLFG
ncbi:RNA polymerase RNAP1 subunit A [Sulfitobacter phage vB_SupP_AX]|nr:RNA polymerase RNAP1 subunit A [Sulfitobacter phage vB_SupP_AX]